MTDNIRTQIGIDLFLFLLTLFFAWLWQWQANDLVWSLWTASFSIGYLSILIIIANAPTHLLKKATATSQSKIQTLKPAQKMLFLVACTPIALFFIGFFTIHFGGFHFVHGMFLSHFFPLEDTAYPTNPAELPAFLLNMTGRYLPFVLVTAVLQRKSLLSRQFTSREPFLKPYINVIRMHLLIFVFFALTLAKASHFAFYALVLFAYFFPWYLFKRLKEAPT